jgi:hypothetical protein
VEADGSPAAVEPTPARTVSAACTPRNRLAAKLAGRENVTVELPTGTLDLPRPLVFSTADSGRDAHTITWEAAPGAHPVLSGAPGLGLAAVRRVEQHLGGGRRSRHQPPASCM